MNIHEAAKKHLLDYPGIQGKAEDIYWIRKPENIKKTCISYFRVDNPKNSLINKYSPRFQFDVWSPNGPEAIEVAELIEKAFDRYKGLMAGTKPIKQGVYDNTQEFYEEDTGLYHVSVDVFFYYLE